ncbi:MAG: hypothetical protein OIF54_15585 [Cohaesibacter sp.]|nr:hypothetical protein [Cohaesibacter sp.]
MLAQGFTSIKIHPYCFLGRDYQLVEELAKEFRGRKIGLSLDTDGMYSIDQTLKMGCLLDREGYVHPSGLPSLGIELDWNAIEQYVYEHKRFKA